MRYTEHKCSEQRWEEAQGNAYKPPAPWCWFLCRKFPRLSFGLLLDLEAEQPLGTSGTSGMHLLHRGRRARSLSGLGVGPGGLFLLQILTSVQTQGRRGTSPAYSAGPFWSCLPPSGFSEWTVPTGAYSLPGPWGCQLSPGAKPGWGQGRKPSSHESSLSTDVGLGCMGCNGVGPPRVVGWGAAAMAGGNGRYR